MDLDIIVVPVVVPNAVPVVPPAAPVVVPVVAPVGVAKAAKRGDPDTLVEVFASD